jgi:hypothetical protein
VIKAVPHRHFVFSIPKILRRYFLYDRNLLSELSRCAWETLKLYLKSFVPSKDAMPGAVIAIQTFGDFLGFNPHCHILCTDGCLIGTGAFRVAPVVVRKEFEEIFRYKVFRMLLSKGKITEELVSMLMLWRHSGFNVFCGSRIYPRDETAMENLARYIIRASFSQERMSYVEEEAQVLYRSKDGKEEKIFDVLEWLAAMCSHVPDRGEQMVRYYGYYSNVCRGKRRKENQDEWIPCILEPDVSSRGSKKSWARLIRKIYEVDPLACPKCMGQMRIIAFIENQEIIRKILTHLGLYLVRSRPPPRAPPKDFWFDLPYSQVSDSQDYLHTDPDYSVDDYFS